ncbi:MAG TPA: sugar isomerase domain-containing protein [Armatimonadota bacterium]|nr:sugar isomerase domain-containing protein [Armatimonadota bacterium]HOS42676.1 sugar isomerase domain-containing protein [Armatimonadota bacterium]
MVPLQYLDAVRGILDFLQETQLPAVEAAADLVVHALSSGGAVFCGEIGHGNQGDFLNRAGGLAAVQPFKFGLGITDPVAKALQDRPRPAPFERDLETIRFAMTASNLRAGDVLLVSSVSGKNRGPVEMALAARDLGVKTIGFTAMPYTRQVEALHPSGNKLFEVVDVVIDCGAPYGDAAVDVPGYDFKLLPVSGVGMTVAGWLIWGHVIEKMVEAGTPPSVFMSINREGGKAYYDQSVAEYQRRGY